MKRLTLVVVAAILLVGTLVGPGAVAAGKDGPAGASNVAHLYLYQKNPADWSIVPGGAWGKMKYNLAGSTFDYVFNGHGLQASTDYSLIYYADGWPGNNPGALIASGTSNAQGNINLAGPVELNTDLPNAADANYPAGGAKIFKASASWRKGLIFLWKWIL